MGFDTGQPTFGVQNVWVATNDGQGHFGSMVHLPSVKTIGVTPEVVTDKLQGNMAITAIATQAISYTLTMDTGGITFAVLQVLTGITPSTSNTDPVMAFANDQFPYFALLAEAWAIPGDSLFFWPYCKVTKGWSYKLEFGKIVVPQLSCDAIIDPTENYILQIYERTSKSGAITIPPMV
jgi:hypothetical protein